MIVVEIWSTMVTMKKKLFKPYPKSEKQTFDHSQNI